MSQCFAVFNFRQINRVLVSVKNLNVWVLPSIANGSQYNKLNNQVPACPFYHFVWKDEERWKQISTFTTWLVLIIMSGICLEDMKKEVNDILVSIWKFFQFLTGSDRPSLPGFPDVSNEARLLQSSEASKGVSGISLLKCVLALAF